MSGPLDRPLHLAFVYPQLKRLTGAQRLIVQLAASCASQGQRVTLLTHRLADAPRALLGPDVGVIETGRRLDWTGRHLIDSALEYALAPPLLRRLPADVDATVFFGPPSLPALATARALGRRPLLSFCYEPPRFAYADRRLIAGRLGALAGPAALAFALYRPLDRWLMGRADLICANGRFGAAEIAEVYRRPALVIDHGVALPAVRPGVAEALRAAYGLGNAPVVLTVGHLHPRKRIDLFLRAVALARTAQPTLRALVVGEGADRPRLEALAAALGLADAVRFTGFVAEADLAALYGLSAAYLHTGQRETFGLSVLEAAAAGCPVVAVDEGGPRDILAGGRHGRLAPAEPSALAQMLISLLADRPAAAQLGAESAAYVRSRFRWENGAAALIEAIWALRRGETETDITQRLSERP